MGDRIALKGKNGCGKSSVLKLILGEQLAHRGSLSVASGLKISYVPQSVDDISGSLTDYADKFDIDESLFKAVLRKLGFARADFERDISDFSAGQKKDRPCPQSVRKGSPLHLG